MDFLLGNEIGNIEQVNKNKYNTKYLLYEK